MPEIEKTRLEMEQDPVSGGISENALKGLMMNSDRMGWTSLEDDSLRETFIPQLKTHVIPYLKRHPIDSTSVKIATKIAKAFSTEHERLPFFSNGSYEQVRVAIVQYEANKILLEDKKEPSYYQLTPFSRRTNNLFVRVGKSVPPQYAPIPNEKALKAIVLLLANMRERIDVRSFTENDVKILGENIQVLNVLFGNRLRW